MTLKLFQCILSVRAVPDAHAPHLRPGRLPGAMIRGSWSTGFLEYIIPYKLPEVSDFCKNKTSFL